MDRWKLWRQGAIETRCNKGKRGEGTRCKRDPAGESQGAIAARRERDKRGEGEARKETRFNRDPVGEG